MKQKIIFLSITLLILFSPNLAFGQQAISLGVYPPILQIETDPPASVKANISIQNLNNQSATYSIELIPFKDSGNLNGETKFVKPDSLYLELFKKVQIQSSGHTVDSVTLSPGQKKDLVLHIGLPKGEKLGDYYFSVLFLSKSTQETLDTSTIGARGGIAVNVLLRVGPKLKASGTIKEFIAPNFVNKGPVKFSVKLLNTGQSFTQTKGNIIVKNMFGQTIGQVELLPVNVLAKSERLVPSKESKDLKDAIWNEKFLLGPYTAYLSLSLSDEGPILKKTASFFAFPIEGVVGLAISLAIVALIVKRIRLKRV